MRTFIAVSMLIISSVAGCTEAPESKPTFAPLSEPRLIGTWQSDADRTIEAARGPLNLTPERETVFRKIFGRLRITYSDKSCSTELDGTVDNFEYHVLGSDATSVAIRSVGSQPIKTLKLSEFSVVHFEGPDTFWIQPEMGPREYFNRLK